MQSVQRALIAIVVGGILMGCTGNHAPDRRGTSVIVFEEFSIEIPLKDQRYRFRFDGEVSNLDDHREKVLKEFGVEERLPDPGPTSAWGRTTTLVERGGVKWAISYILPRSDERIFRAMLTHEKYHALARLSPQDLPALHSAVEASGFHIEWSQYDEELRASIVQVASLHAQGVPLDNLGGDEQLARVLGILKSGRRSAAVDAPP